MKIVFGHHAFTMQRYGGISRYFHELSSHISKSGNHNVEIFAPVFDNAFLANRGDSSITGWNVPRVPGTNFARQPLNNLVSRLVLRGRHDVDIYHETYYSIPDLGPASAKRIVTVYDMIHELSPERFTATDNTRVAKQTAMDRADHIICISDNTRSDLMRLTRVPRSKLSVIHLACAAPIENRAIAVLPFRTRPYILFVGQRASYKNFNALLHGYASSSVLRSAVAMVCFGGGEFTDEERSLFRSLLLGEHDVVHCSGDDRMLAALYSSAAAFVYPSLYEGFGIPTLEAMSLGCPVVCSNTSSLPEVVGDAAELFDPHQPTDMISAIEHVLMDRVRSQQLVASGYARVQQFSWEKCARETVAVYEQVLA